MDHDFFDWVLEVLGGEGLIATLARRLARFDWLTVEHVVLNVLYESVFPHQRERRWESITRQSGWPMPCMAELPIVNVYLAREMARRGDRDDASRSCAPPSTICSARTSAVWGVAGRGFWWRHGHRGDEEDVAEAEAVIERLGPRQPMRVSGYARSGCCGCGLDLRGLTAMRRLMRTCGIATATWRDRLASRGISPGPRRCHDGGRIGVRGLRLTVNVGAYAGRNFACVRNLDWSLTGQNAPIDRSVITSSGVTV